MTLFWGFFISVLPAIAILCYFYECDRGRGESYQDKLKAFLMGFACMIKFSIQHLREQYRLVWEA